MQSVKISSLRAAPEELQEPLAEDADHPRLALFDRRLEMLDQQKTLISMNTRTLLK